MTLFLSIRTTLADEITQAVKAVPLALSGWNCVPNMLSLLNRGDERQPWSDMATTSRSSEHCM